MNRRNVRIDDIRLSFIQYDENIFQFKFYIEVFFLNHINITKVSTDVI